MAARVNVQQLKALRSELTTLGESLQSSHQDVMSEANQLRWNDDRLRVMLGFLNETVQMLQTAQAGIEAYLPDLDRQIYLLTEY